MDERTSNNIDFEEIQSLFFLCIYLIPLKMLKLKNTRPMIGKGRYNSYSLGQMATSKLGFKSGTSGIGFKSVTSYGRIVQDDEEDEETVKNCQRYQELVE